MGKRAELIILLFAFSADSDCPQGKKESVVLCFHLRRVAANRYIILIAPKRDTDHNLVSSCHRYKDSVIVNIDKKLACLRYRPMLHLLDVRKDTLFYLLFLAYPIRMRGSDQK